MWFEVRRTSRRDDQQPCRDAVKKDVRKVSPAYGTETQVWALKIATVKALMEFVARHEGQVCITHHKDGRLPELEIYDTWRE